jgi:SAM-dependent methyltransferase
MDMNTKKEPPNVRKFLRLLRGNGPLAIIKLSSSTVQRRLSESSSLRPLLVRIDTALESIQKRLDSRFDREHDTETSEIILSLNRFPTVGENVMLANEYRPTSPKVFKQIMQRLTINHGDFEFVDFGSGKGRVLLLASEYGFKRVVGVEFAPDLCRIASTNIERWNQKTGRSPNIEIFCTDATDFPIPVSPLVVFFFSPFKGKVMERVLDNITASWSADPREIFLIFHGLNPDTLELLRATGRVCKELKLRPDWSLLLNYRTFLITYPKFDDGVASHRSESAIR